MWNEWWKKCCIWYSIFQAFSAFSHLFISVECNHFTFSIQRRESFLICFQFEFYIEKKFVLWQLYRRYDLMCFLIFFIVKMRFFSDSTQLVARCSSETHIKSYRKKDWSMASREIVYNFISYLLTHLVSSSYAAVTSLSRLCILIRFIYESQRKTHFLSSTTTSLCLEAAKTLPTNENRQHHTVSSWR